MVIYCFFIAVWSTSFLEMWKRCNSQWALFWGMLGYVTKEQPRSDFNGIRRENPSNDQPEIWHESNSIYYSKLMSSASVIFFMICVVLSAVSGTFFLCFVLEGSLILYKKFLLKVFSYSNIGLSVLLIQNSGL